MSSKGINKYEEKERREQRRRNHEERDMRREEREAYVALMKLQRKRKWMITEDEGFYDDDSE